MDQEDKNKSPYNRASEWTGDASGIPKAAEESHVEHNGFYRGDRDVASKDLSDLEKATADNGAEPTSAQNASEFENNVRGSAPLSVSAQPPFSDLNRLNLQKRTPLKAAGKFRKFAPLGFIMTLLIAGGMLILGAQSILPFSLGEVLKGAFDTVLVSTTARTHVWFKAQMDPDRTIKPATKDTWLGTKFNKFSDKQISNLAAQGIEVVEDVKLSNGKTITVLVSDDGSGNKSIITPDSKYNDEIDKAKFTNDRLKEIRQNTTGKLTTVDLETKYSTDNNYHNKHNAAFASWRSSVATWYNKRTSNYLSRWGLTRDLFHSYETGKQTLADIKSEIQERIKNGEGTSKYKGVNADGNAEDGGSDKFSSSDFADKESARAKVSQLAKSYAEKAGSKSDAIDMAANVTCGIMGFVGSMSLMAAASEAQQFMTLALAYLEAIDKTKQGDGDESPLNELTNTLVEPSNVEDADGNIVREGTTAMQAVNIQSAYGATVDSRNDASASKFNPATMYNNAAAHIAQDVTTTATAFSGCLVGKIAAAAVSASVDLGIAASCIATIAGGAGVGSVIPGLGTAAGAGAGILGCLGEVATNWIVGIGIGVGLVAAIEAVAPMVGDWMFNLFKNDVTEYTGEDLGNAIFAGTSTLMSGVARSNGQSLASEDIYNQFVGVQNEVNAEIAREVRANLSPFDTTSQYTFLGSIMAKLGTAANSSSIPFSNLMATVTRTTKSSLSTFLPAAAAEPFAPTASTDTCPEVSSINAVCNASGQPNTITDPRTLEDDPADIVEHIQDDLNLNGENPTVKTDDIINNETAKYIIFCENRDSSFGAYDQNIADTITSLLNGGNSNSILNAIKYSTPVAGNIVSIFEDGTVLENADYVSGEACVAGSVAYEKHGNQYIARFEEDQQLAKSMGLISETAAEIFLEEWYKDHPLDESLEGVIARRTGMRKDDVIALLDTLEEAYEIANYDPTDLGPINNTKEDAPAFAGAPEDKPMMSTFIAIEVGRQDISSEINYVYHTTTVA